MRLNSINAIIMIRDISIMLALKNGKSERKEKSANCRSKDNIDTASTD